MSIFITIMLVTSLRSEKCLPKLVYVNFITPLTQDPIEQLILAHVPVAWLHADELYKPLSFEEYITDKDTKIIYWPNHKKKNPNKNEKVILKEGNLSYLDLWCLGNYPLPEHLSEENAELLCNTTQLQKKFLHTFNGSHSNDLYLEGSSCIEHGTHKETVFAHLNDLDLIVKNKNNTIYKTPIYAFYSEEENGLAYIQYCFFYGYNGTYGVHIPYAGLLSYINIYKAGAHPIDLEHLTLEFEKSDGNYSLRRLGFDAHGSGEMKWRNVDDKELQFEHFKEEDLTKPATHPVVFIAKNGHGVYPPPAGTWLRICGQANDICAKGERWEPLVTRLEVPVSPHFNPETMGISAFQGDLGNDGVGGFIDKAFIGKARYEDSGMSKSDSLKTFCPERSSLYNSYCLLKTRPYSCFIPKSYQALIGTHHVFDKNVLPPEFIRVKKDSVLIFNKKSTRKLTYTQKNDAPVKPQQLQVKNLALTQFPLNAAFIEETDTQWMVTFNKTGLMQLIFFEDSEMSSYDEAQFFSIDYTKRLSMLKKAAFKHKNKTIKVQVAVQD